jgi:arsenate reductase
VISLIHNPRCSKSRQALELLSQYADRQGKTLEVIDYQKSPLDAVALSTLQRQLGLAASDMLRSNESILKEQNIDTTTLSEQEVITLIAKHPVLLQRPIVVQAGRAIIARPPEVLHTWLS